MKWIVASRTGCVRVGQVDEAVVARRARTVRVGGKWIWCNTASYTVGFK